MILKLSLDLPEEKDYIRLIRVLGKGLLEHLNVNQRDIDDVETILSELASNVVRHAHSTDGRFSLVLEYYATRVVITITDKGTGFSLVEAAARPEERLGMDGEFRLGGYGLMMTDALCDQLQFLKSDCCGTTVKAEKLLSYDTPLDAQYAAAMNRGETGNVAVTLM